jgi:uncharacterized protein YdbL (DUF1318 family)
MNRTDFFNVGAAVLLALAAAPPAIAQTAAAKAAVDAAKAAGIVGEQADGFLGFVKPGDAAQQAAVAEINAGRAQLYREAAAKNNVSAQAAGASAYTNVVQARIKPGEYFKPAGGGWTRK